MSRDETESILDCREFSLRGIAAHDRRERNSGCKHFEHVGAARRWPVFFRPTGAEQLSIQMALQDIFKFRELPESRNFKPFLEHLEDLRWTIVKVAITLVAAMIICFAFRSTLVRVMQAPLHDIDPQVGALRALGITDSTGDFISSRVLRRHRSFLSAPSLFFGGICSARAHRRGEALFASRHLRQLRAISAWRAGLLFLVAA